MPPPKVRDVIRRLEQDGWTLVRMRGTHRQYRHPDYPDVVTVPGHPNKVLAPGTWRAIVRKAGWNE